MLIPNIGEGGSHGRATCCESLTVPMILGIVGGAMLFLGSFLTWATVSIDVTKFAQALGVDPALLQGAVGSTSQSFSGMHDSGDGIFTLIAGLVVIVLAVVVFLKADLGKIMGALMIVAGAIGAGVAIYDLSRVNNVKDDALNGVAGQLQSAGIDPGVLDGVIKVAAGIGIYVCAIGGIVAVVAGIMALMNKSSSAPAMTSSMGTAAEPQPVASTRRRPRPAAPMSSTPAAPEPPAPTPPASPSPAPSTWRRRPHRNRRRHPKRAVTGGGGSHPYVRTREIQIATGGRRIVDLTEDVEAFVAEEDADGLLHVFAPHATAGVALIETGAGTEGDLEAAIERLLPREDRYAHRHGSVGHGGDHVLPAFVAPSLIVPVIGGRPALGDWQSVVLVDPNRENDLRTVRLSFVPA